MNDKWSGVPDALRSSLAVRVTGLLPLSLLENALERWRGSLLGELIAQRIVRPLRLEGFCCACSRLISDVPQPAICFVIVQSTSL